MRILLIFISIVFVVSMSYGQGDTYLDGMSVCVDKKTASLIQGLYKEVDARLVQYYQADSVRFRKFAFDFYFDDIDSSIFKVDRGSMFDSLILQGIHQNFWELSPSSDSLAEPMHIRPDQSFLSCSKLFTFHSDLANYYAIYPQMGIAESKVKMQAMADAFFSDEDYFLTAVKYFIALDVFVQKALHFNGYDVRE